ncbi:MAG: peptidylprolyl isomerase [Syntrophales bacterium]
MITTSHRFMLIGAAVLFACLVTFGCDSQKQTAATAGRPVIAPGPAADQPAGGSLPAKTAPVQGASAAAAADSAVAVEVDGVKLTRSQLDREVQTKLAGLGGQVSAENLENGRMEVRKAVIDEFIVRTLLDREISRKKLTASDREIKEILDAMKKQLPAGATLEELFEKNKIDPAVMREEIGLNVRIGKLVTAEMGSSAKVTDKEITDFYRKNQDQFKQPEAIHARHILIAKGPEDTAKVAAEKKTQAEELRRQLIAGADFAELAKKNSACPSKQNGGDLGYFSRGQMVKPFEEAAFSQQTKAIGPVVETEFGYHIIQVLERRAATTVKLDAETKKQVTAFLERQKKEAAYEGLIKRLKATANIVVYGN